MLTHISMFFGKWIDLCQWWNFHKFDFELRINTIEININWINFLFARSIGFNISVFLQKKRFFFSNSFSLWILCSIFYRSRLVGFCWRWVFNLLTSVFYFVMATIYFTSAVLRYGCWCMRFITAKRQTFVLKLTNTLLLLLFRPDKTISRATREKKKTFQTPLLLFVLQHIYFLTYSSELLCIAQLYRF